MTRPFCLLSTGRAGSSALMAAFASHADIAVPQRDLRKDLGEMLGEKHIAATREALERSSGRSLPSHGDLIEAFYQRDPQAAYAGFKLMPWQHPQFASFTQRPDVRFMVLLRRDLGSMIASWFVAHRYETWRESSARIVRQWTFGSDHQQEVYGHVMFAVRNLRQLVAVPQAIRLYYEDLCQPAYRNAEMEVFFGRPIRLIDPHPPTDARSYVSNWAEFLAFVRAAATEQGLRMSP